MMRKSASLFEWLSGLLGVWVGLPFGVGCPGSWVVIEAHQAGTASVARAMGAMCRGSCVKDRAYVHVQLESLILAQNERWRQA